MGSIVIIPFVIIIVMAMVSPDAGLLLLYVMSYLYAVSLLACILVMAFYAVSYLHYLWKAGFRKKALEGLLAFVLLNILAGYLWYRQAEVKGQQIDFM